jgi:hypothetical protein
VSAESALGQTEKNSHRAHVFRLNSDIARRNWHFAFGSARDIPNGGICLRASSEPLPRCLPRNGKRLSDSRPTHLAFAEDVGDILHRSTNPFEGTIVSGQSF